MKTNPVPDGVEDVALVVCPEAVVTEEVLEGLSLQGQEGRRLSPRLEVVQEVATGLGGQGRIVSTLNRKGNFNIIKI